jgi:hypothetical protein
MKICPPELQGAGAPAGGTVGTSGGGKGAMMDHGMMMMPSTFVFPSLMLPDFNMLIMSLTDWLKANPLSAAAFIGLLVILIFLK